ncbi:hypothetical protein PP7435_CHR2-1276 [Komagataella phaffii CBS 7435]|uniref:Oxidation resistance protein 1 n=1 Tax=Komagataella phaffii (strain ATCC 76273 / CBS 7435 / CECT 11047 / NRRL Y-11430 / Wegner 21-1) TaxID=981350 RepID=F2QU72_KOMPC|nr:GQ67_00056T0 [Komagataella phaffii]AOA68066.1 GQ68_01331T0 [Komagataella phaffii GS115]CAH2448873.1 hypothetical protein BQ9382_C2-6860 [Komagataella phaffii CBS 7435]CCA38950.1 hypothetical protein PP7435_CHR2-1276 [Komagataella phaffii CBS 7435]
MSKLKDSIKSLKSTTREEPPDYHPFDPPLTGLELNGYKNTTKQRLLHKELAEDLRLHLPARLQVTHNWNLLYSLEQDGISLNTLYKKMRPLPSEINKRYGYLLVIRDSHHNVFGAYVSDYLRPIERKQYYGNGECFLWKAEKDTVPNLVDLGRQEELDVQYRLKVFPYTSLNDFIIYTNYNSVSIGSGDGKFGLWIDGDLDKGASDPVDTFGNEKLSDESTFRIFGLEVWRI